MSSSNWLLVIFTVPAVWLSCGWTPTFISSIRNQLPMLLCWNPWILSVFVSNISNMSNHWNSRDFVIEGKLHLRRTGWDPWIFIPSPLENSSRTQRSAGKAAGCSFFCFWDCEFPGMSHWFSQHQASTSNKTYIYIYTHYICIQYIYIYFYIYKVTNWWHKQKYVNMPSVL